MDDFHVAALRAEFPGKNVFPNAEHGPTEIVVELSKTDAESVAISLIERSAPHLHRARTERYEVIDGTLELFVDGQGHVLRVGDAFQVMPNHVHWASASPPARVRVTVAPPWTPDDHILVDRAD